MKAIVYEQYGAPDVLRITDLPRPTPNDSEVLIKVHAATVTTGDVNMRGFTFVPPGFGPLPRLMFGIRKPRKPILGTEIAGEVVAIGSAVTRFRVGDAVYGIDSDANGAYAEYACRPADGALAQKPANLSYEEAAAIPFGAGTALNFLKYKGGIQPGQKVLVNGASGGTGSYAVQLAKHFGAEVTGVCSTRNIELVKSLGADHVIDYTKTDFTESGETYDLIFDTVVGKTSFTRCRRVLKPGGRYLAVAGGLQEMLQAARTSLFGACKVIAGTPTETAETLELLNQIIEQGKVRVLIDRCYPLEQIVEAHRYVDTGRKRGNVVITVTPNTQDG